MTLPPKWLMQLTEVWVLAYDLGLCQLRMRRYIGMPPNEKTRVEWTMPRTSNNNCLTCMGSF
ncbi:MAG: hypothetical protein IPK92_21855 [Nitrospira sp.]|nr:hypothetical protein [Nitrospira sp.]